MRVSFYGRLVWAHSKDADFSGADSRPLVSFGEKCFFRHKASRLLGSASIPVRSNHSPSLAVSEKPEELTPTN